MCDVELDKSWIKFMKSGSAFDYLEFVNVRKGNEISGQAINTVLNRGFGNKGNECGRE